jgi:glycosyltransferase involved in cell wall biosynthesis
MRVLLVSQYFPPETGGPPNRAASLARGIRAAGHEVWVLAEKPSHPEGRIWPEYRGGFMTWRRWDGIPVLYVWVYASPKKGLWSRVGNHLSFLVSAVLASLALCARFDVVLSTSPPLFAGAAGRVIAGLRRAAHVLDVRDLWPDIAVAMGELRQPRWIGLSKRLERSLYRSADAVTAVTESFCSTIAAQVEHPAVVHLVRNGSEPGFFGQRDPATVAALRGGLGAAAAHFLVGYVGNLGIAQGLPHLVEAARLAAAASDPVHFVFVGTGPLQARLQARVAELQLPNVSFISRTAPDRAADWMAAMDALVVSLARVDMLEQFVPSKLYDALAAGRPVLLGARGESARILESSGGGRVYEPEDAAGLLDAVRALARDPKCCRRLGEAGARYARAHCDRAQHAQVMVGVLEAARRAHGRPRDPADRERASVPAPRSSSS